MTLFRTLLIVLCAAPLLVAEDGVPTQEQLQSKLKTQEAALADLQTKIQNVRDALAKDESIAPLQRAAKDAEAAFAKAWQEDADLVAARKSENETRDQYAKTVDKAVKDDAEGKTLIGRIEAIGDDSFDLEIKRRLAQLETDNALRPRIERKDPEVAAAGQKLNTARWEYDQREQKVAEFQAARQKIVSTQQTVQNMENSPSIQAARKALDDLLKAPELTAARQAAQAANAAYEQLRREHALTKAFQEAEQQYHQILNQKIAQSERGKELAETIAGSATALKGNQETHQKTVQDVNVVRGRVEKENQAVLAAAKTHQEAAEKRQAAERGEALTKLAQQRDAAWQAHREAVAKAEADKGLPELLAKVNEASKQAAATQADLRAVALAGQLKPAAIDAATLENGLICAAFNTPDAAAAKPLYTGTVAGVDLEARPADENFTVDYQGFIKLDAKGIYTFALNSDDGSLLYLGGVPIIDNGGMHGMVRKEQKILLEAGLYPIRLVFYQGGGPFGLEFTMAVGEGEAKPVPATVLFAKKADLAALKTVAELKAAAKPPAK